MQHADCRRIRKGQKTLLARRTAVPETVVTWRANRPKSGLSLRDPTRIKGPIARRVHHTHGPLVLLPGGAPRRVNQGDDPRHQPWSKLRFLDCGVCRSPDHSSRFQGGSRGGNRPYRRPFHSYHASQGSKGWEHLQPPRPQFFRGRGAFGPVGRLAPQMQKTETEIEIEIGVGVGIGVGIGVGVGIDGIVIRAPRSCAIRLQPGNRPTTRLPALPKP